NEGAVRIDALKRQVRLVDIEADGVTDAVASGLGISAWRDQNRRSAVRRVDGVLYVLVAAIGAELVDQQIGRTVDDDLFDTCELVGFAVVGDDPMTALDGEMIARVIAGRGVGAGAADDRVVTAEAGKH